MRINKEFETHWFEDKDGNKIPADCDEKIDRSNAEYYHSCFPCQFSEEIFEYCYHPKNWFVKLVCRNSHLYKIISEGKPKTFRRILIGHQGFGAGWSQRCIVAMVNSGEYTLEQAIYVYAKSCERCSNVLIYKYLNREDGYEEYSDEWQECETCCEWCKHEAPNAMPPNSKADGEE